MIKTVCKRCVKHAGKPWHWCIRVAIDGNRVLGECSCPCRGRSGR
jgi:hypothetical protein